VTDSGWRQAPRLRDLTEVSFGASAIQIDGTVVPVADVDLGPGDSIFFEHHVMLWKEERVAMSVMDAPGGMQRMLSNLPFVLSVAAGPGGVSLSRDAPGEIVVLPIDEGVEIDVREHAMLVATAGLSYSFERLPGLHATLVTGSGMYLDRFRAERASGLLLLHGYGNVSERTLTDGETIEVEPGAFLYKEASVTIAPTTYKLVPEGTSSASQSVKGLAGRGLAGLRAAKALRKEGIQGLFSGEVLTQAGAVLSGPGITLMKMTGPGRVGIQSMYRHHGSA
jgi:uncharacterized protein (AIM24 family)